MNNLIKITVGVLLSLAMSIGFADNGTSQNYTMSNGSYSIASNKGSTAATTTPTASGRYSSFRSDCGNLSQRIIEVPVPLPSGVERGSKEAFDNCKQKCDETSKSTVRCDGFSFNSTQSNCYLKSLKENQCVIPLERDELDKTRWIFYRKQ